MNVLLKYNLLEKKQTLIRIIIVISLLSVSTLGVTLLDQVITPSFFANNLKNYDNLGIAARDNDFEGALPTSTNKFDFSWYRSYSETFACVTNFTTILERSVLRVFGNYAVASSGCIIKNSIELPSFAPNNSTVILGLNNNLYSRVVTAINQSDPVKAMALLTEEDDPLVPGNFSFFCNGFEREITIERELNGSTLAGELPVLTDYLNYIRINGPKRLLFVSIEYFKELFVGISTGGVMEGFIAFNEGQQAELYWSVDSLRKINRFAKTFEKELLKRDPSLQQFSREDFAMSAKSKAQNNMFIVNLFYSFIRAIQIVIIALSAFLITSSMIKIKKEQQRKALRWLMAGQSWKERLPLMVMESMLLAIVSNVFALMVILPLIPLLNLLSGLSLEYTTHFWWSYLIQTIIVFALLFIVSLDFEYYLSRLLQKGFSSEKYTFLGKFPKRLKIVLGLTIPLVLLLLANNWTLLSTAYQLAFLALFAVVAAVVMGLIVLITWLSQKIAAVLRRKKDRARNGFQLLFCLWQKSFYTKMFAYTIILASLVTLSVNGSIYKETMANDMYFNHGAEIDFRCKDESNIVPYETILEGHSAILDYTPVLEFRQYQHNRSKIILNESGLSDEELYRVNYAGINITDYFDFYRDWDKKWWLREGEVTNLTNQSVFVSDKFKQYGYTLGSTLTFTDNSSFVVKGFLHYRWPLDFITETSFYVIMSQSQLVAKLQTVNITKYDYFFKVHTSIENIFTVFDYLEPKLQQQPTFVILVALDPNIISAYRQIFQSPSYLIMLAMIFYFAALYLNLTFRNPIHDPVIQRFALLSLVRDPRKALLRYRFFEVGLALSLFFIITVPFFIRSVIWDPTLLTFPVESIKLAGLFFGIYFSIIVIHTLFENYRLKNVQLSKLYRHPE